jgi:hypothetical protein
MDLFNIFAMDMKLLKALGDFMNLFPLFNRADIHKNMWYEKN